VADIPDEEQNPIDQVRDAPFRVLEEKAPCSCCKDGGVYTVEYPDGSTLSVSHAGEEGKEEAERIADWMNEAWDMALVAAKSALAAYRG
jgi:ArsR family metal-binding transcriptional regulator